MTSSRPYVVYTGGIAAQLLTIGIARFAYTPLLPVMQEQAGLTAEWAGILGALIYAGYLSGTLILALVKSPEVRLMVFRICLILGVISTAIMGMTDNVWIWALTRFLGGLSGVGGMLLGGEFILGWLRRHGRQPDLGPHFVGIGLGISLAGLITLMMGPSALWTQQWLVFSAVALFLLPFAWLLTPRPPARLWTSEQTPMDHPKRDTGWFWIFGIGYFAAGWGYAVGATFCVDILTSGGQSNSDASAVWLILGLATAVGALAGSIAARMFGAMPVLLVCMICQVLALSGFALHPGLIASYVAAIMFGGTFVVIVSLSLMLAGLHSPGAEGTAMARMTLLYSCAQIIAPVTTARLVTQTGSYGTPLMVAAVIVAIGVVCMAWASTRAEKSSRTST